MDTKKLEYFLRIAEEGSLNRAANILYIAQPALSRQLRLLEEQLGVELFERSRQGMRLTEEGKQLRKMVSGPLRQLTIALNNFKATSTHLAGNLIIGMPPSTAYMLALPVIQRLEQNMPDLQAHVVEENESQLVDHLIAGEIDVAFLHDPAPHDQVVCRDLLVEEFVLVGLPDSTTRPQKPLTFRHMAKLPLILPSHGHEIRRHLEHQAIVTQTTLNVRYECDSFQLTKELIAAGMGYGILPYSAFSREDERTRFEHVNIYNPNIVRHLVMAALPYRGMQRVTANLDTVVKEEIIHQVGEGRIHCRVLFDH